MSIKCELKKLKPDQLGSSWNSTLMKACVPIIGVCGTHARNYGIDTNYFVFLLLTTGSGQIKLQENGL